MCSRHVHQLNYYVVRLLHDDCFHGCNGLLDLPSEKSAEVGIWADWFYAFNIVPNGICDRPRNKYDCWSGSLIAYPSSALLLSCIWLIQCSFIVFTTQKLSVPWWNHHDDDASYVFLLTNWVALFIRKHVRTWLPHVRPVYRLSVDHFRHLNYRWASGTGLQKCCRSRFAPVCGLVRALYKNPAYSNWTWRQKRQKKED